MTLEADEYYRQEDIRYELTECEKSVEGIGVVKVYGIAVYADGHKGSDDTTKCAVIDDISSNREAVEGFVQKMREAFVSPVHLEDCFEDYVTT